MADVRVVLFEDDPRYRKSLETMLAHAPGVCCVAAYSRLGPGLAEAARAEVGWDVILMDLELPDGSGIDAIREIKSRRPDIAIVAITVFEEPATVLRAICAGADGYLLKRSSVAELLSAIRHASTGGAPLTPSVAAEILGLLRAQARPAGPAPVRVGLTDREQEVLRALARGATYRSAGEELGLSVDTVRTHVRSLYKKLQVHNVGEAISRAIREGLV